MAMTGKATYLSLLGQAEGSAMFRYYLSTNQHNYPILIKFFNLQTKSKNLIVNKGTKMAMESITTN